MEELTDVGAPVFPRMKWQGTTWLSKAHTVLSFSVNLAVFLIEWILCCFCFLFMKGKAEYNSKILSLILLSNVYTYDLH